jgi:membrane fusion protein (multidrug efflux system)
VDPLTGTIKVRLVFPNPDRILIAGMTCNVQVENNDAGNSILIPYKAVLEQMGEYFAFVVKDSNKVHQQRIALGQQIGDKIIVKSGLEQGQVIVTDGVQKLKEGSAVQTGSANDQSAGIGKTPGTDSTKEK